VNAHKIILTLLEFNREDIRHAFKTDEVKNLIKTIGADIFTSPTAESFFKKLDALIYRNNFTSYFKNEETFYAARQYFINLLPEIKNQIKKIYQAQEREKVATKSANYGVMPSVRPSGAIHPAVDYTIDKLNNFIEKIPYKTHHTKTHNDLKDPKGGVIQRLNKLGLNKRPVGRNGELIGRPEGKFTKVFNENKRKNACRHKKSC
jgi:hypothetical protein